MRRTVTPNDDFEWWANLPDRDAWVWVPVETMTEPGVFDHPHSRLVEARAHPVPGRDHDGETPRLTLPTPRANGWRAEAACRGVDPVEFFPDHRGWHNYSYVAGLCAGCPVYDECLEDALLDEGAWTTFGFRAGMTADERREFAKEIAA